MRIVNHARSMAPDIVSGHLLGMDVDSTLEVTSCFPMPADQPYSKIL